MKKIFFFAAIAAAALSSCSSDELVQAEQPVEDGAVLFSANTMRVNRADPSTATVFGDPVISTAELANQGGFGIFGYDQNAVVWKTFSAGNTYPNFFYNQQVWGAELNGTTGHKADKTTPTEYAKDDDVEWKYSPVKYFNNNKGALHSFFAYAPYQEHPNVVFTYDGPAIRYSATDNYDLLTAQSYIDQEKPGVNYEYNFNFEHSLSQVSFDVATFVNKVHPITDTHTPSEVEEPTKVTLRSVKFTGNLPTQALVSLKDGSWKVEKMEEGMYEFCAAPVEMDHAQTEYYHVTEKPVMVLPTLDDIKAKVQVTYDVETIDNDNPQNSSVITNIVTSEEEFDLSKGHAYQFHLDLGLTSVKFNAEVVDWKPATEQDVYVDLPNNTHAEPLALTDALSGKAVPSSITLNDADTDGSYKVEDGKLKKYVSTEWKNAPASVYNVDKTIYVVTGSEGAEETAIHTNVEAYESSTGTYVVWEGTAYSSTAKTPKPVDSIVPDSEGKLYKNGEEVSVANNDVIICNGKLYIWKVS